MEALRQERPSSLAPFRHGVFTSIWTASIASNFGGLIQGVGAAWLMTSISDSAGMVALVQASSTLPIMLFSLTSGAIADSFDRRKVMLTAQIFMLVVSAALTATAWFGLITPWLLLTFTFLIGAGIALNNPSWQATVGDIVPKADLPAAVLLNSVSFNMTRSVGPAVGGAIVAAGGAAAAFAVNTVSYLALIMVLLRWRSPPIESNLPRERLGAAVATGLRYVAMSPNLAKVMLRGFLFGLTTIVVLALLPLVARDLVGGGALTYGALLGAFGVGAVGGAFISPHLRERLSSENVIRLGFGAFAITAVATGVAGNVWVISGALMVGGAAWVISLSLFNVTVQLSTPRWVVGRALSLYQMAVFGGMALGSWVWGALAEAQGVEIALLAAAAAMLVGAASGLLVPVPGRAELDLDPLNTWTRPAVEIDVQPRSGPISISIEYLIDPETVSEFLNAMNERERIRRRDGARRWVLMRDIEDPRRWVETYNIPTWVEYIRYNQRPTMADAVVGARIRALHTGSAPPVVHRMIFRQTTRREASPAPRAPLDIH